MKLTEKKLKQLVEEQVKIAISNYGLQEESTGADTAFLKETFSQKAFDEVGVAVADLVPDAGYSESFNEGGWGGFYNIYSHIEDECEEEGKICVILLTSEDEPIITAGDCDDIINASGELFPDEFIDFYESLEEPVQRQSLTS